MIEIIVALAFMLGGYEYGKAEVKPCQKDPQVVVQCTDIQPPEDESFGAQTRAYSSLITQYRKCKKACTN